MNTQSSSPIFTRIGYFLNLLFIFWILAFRLNWISDSQNGEGAFAIHLIVLAYCLPSLLVKSYRKDKTIWILSSLAFFQSAYILNGYITVFEAFDTWYILQIFLLHILYLSWIFIDKTSKTIQRIHQFFIGFLSINLIIQIIYLIPILPYSAIGLILIGLGIYAFSPIIYLALLLKELAAHNRKKQISLWWFGSGLALSSLIMIVIMSIWSFKLNAIHKTFTETTLHETELPQWVLLGQTWGQDWISERILLTDLEFTSPINGFNNIGNNSFREKRRFDPFAFLGQVLFEDIQLDAQTKMKILNANFDKRHKSYTKLWTGKDLSTSQIISNIKVYPEYRLAYVEKTIEIKNNFKRWGRNQQEALYTFYLPEGGLATSLSLWVNGVEEKSRLTTKKKASQAYNQIVGVQRRDPALLHWQEGNKITVTVFPCTPEENRQFKIGFTIPLQSNNEEILLEDIPILGPDFSKTRETKHIQIASNNPIYENLNLTGFDLVGPQKFQQTAGYFQFETLSIPKVPLGKKPFIFNKKAYILQNPTEINHPISATLIYLDLNKNWHQKEVEQLLSKFPEKKFYVYQNGWIKLQEHKLDQIMENAQKKAYSIFPFHHIYKPKNSLVISKSTVWTPNIGELKKTKFGQNFRSFLDQNKDPIKVIELNTESSNYLSGLSQFGAIDLKKTTFEEVETLLKKGLWSQPKLDSNAIYLPVSKLIITEENTHENTPSVAPDHLMRLHHYNLIMKTIGADFYRSDSYEFGPLIDLANNAYVASPISSMIVLETIKDYKRFDIKKNKNSLKNAKMNQSGAVPEPHEWALIIISLISILIMKIKRLF